jgi:hypothetical protein
MTGKEFQGVNQHHVTNFKHDFLILCHDFSFHHMQMKAGILIQPLLVRDID